MPRAPVVVGRLAPSPTGLLHLGHARSFVLSWWHARSRGGRVVLRLEDVDVARASAEHLRAAELDLSWLGLDWDGPARVQSAGLSRLTGAAKALAAAGRAYACVCSRGELVGAPHGSGGEPRYPGTCRGRYEDLEAAEREAGRAAGLRLLVEPGPVTFDDALHGPQCFDVSEEVGDFLVLRRDKTPAYQLAVVVDDAFDGVTEVVRGADLLPSTARQILVQRALSLPPVTYAHVPLVCDANGRRLAKRSADLSLTELRARGVDPRAVVAWVARSSGQLPEDAQAELRVTPAELLGRFSLARVPREPVRLDGTLLEALLTAR
jgi:glutamyl-tRNA synthetase